MELRQSLFWDTDVKTLDTQKHKRHIIERTLTRGRIGEVRQVFAFYGRETICEVMLNARYLDKLTLSLCVALFNKPLTDFRCYKLAQSNPPHWDY